MNKLLVVCGPTATGKTGLAVKLAKKFNGELISADSRQVYRGMDIGTGKDLPVNSKLKIKNEKLQIKIKKGQILKPYRFNKIPVWLLDVAEPNYRFSAADYLKLAELIIKDIRKRKKLPILVGGTGFYTKAVIDGIKSLGIEPDWKLRGRLSRLSIEQLKRKLRNLDSKRFQKMNESDRQNPRRLIRAIEIATAKLDKTIKKVDKNDVLIIGLTASYQFLYRRIDERVEKRLKQGLVKEIEKLLSKGFTWEDSALGETLAYKEWWPFFEGKVSKKEVIQRWKFNEHGYARRQITWFKKDKRINWFDISQKKWQDKVEKLVKKWYFGSNAKKS